MKKPLVYFSEVLNISGKEFSEKGLLNPSVNGDILLFIDPRLLAKSRFEIFREDAKKAYDEYYEMLAKCVKKILRTTNLTVQNKMKENLCNYLKAEELDGLTLGYADGNPGSGVGDKYARAIMQNALDLYENNDDNDPIVFSLLHILTEGIGADYIGDITSQIIKKQIYQFTEEKASEMGIKTECFDNLCPGFTFKLPVHPTPPKKKRIPILFVPRDILNYLPVDVNLEDVFNDFSSDNDLIRQGVNTEISRILQNNEQKKDKQSKIFEFIKNNKEVADMECSITPKRKYYKSSY